MCAWINSFSNRLYRHETLLMKHWKHPPFIILFKGFCVVAGYKYNALGYNSAGPKSLECPHPTAQLEMYTSPNGGPASVKKKKRGQGRVAS